jgi:hypothetical protein
MLLLAGIKAVELLAAPPGSISVSFSPNRHPLYSALETTLRAKALREGSRVGNFELLNCELLFIIIMMCG